MKASVHGSGVNMGWMNISMAVAGGRLLAETKLVSNTVKPSRSTEAIRIRTIICWSRFWTGQPGDIETQLPFWMRSGTAECG